jgi:hypothetical protein
MLDGEFCIALELAITSTLKQSTNVDLKRCWCNGIILPENDTVYSIEQVLKTRQLIAKAWIDEGQGEDEGLQYLYVMRLNFGEKSVDKLRTGDRLVTCIPLNALIPWLTFDKENKRFDVQLR